MQCCFCDGLIVHGAPLNVMPILRTSRDRVDFIRRCAVIWHSNVTAWVVFLGAAVNISLLSADGTPPVLIPPLAQATVTKLSRTGPSYRWTAVALGPLLT